MHSLIPADDTWSLWAIMLVGVAVSVYWNAPTAGRPRSAAPCWGC